MMTLEEREQLAPRTWASLMSPTVMGNRAYKQRGESFVPFDLCEEIEMELGEVRKQCREALQFTLEHARFISTPDKLKVQAALEALQTTEPKTSMKTNNWSILRWSRGGGKTRPHIIATGLGEYAAKNLCRDAERGTRNFVYRVVSPKGKRLTFIPTKISTDGAMSGTWTDLSPST